MGFLTKEERETWRVAVGDGHVFQPEDVELALDTIGALEAERDKYKAAAKHFEVEYKNKKGALDHYMRLDRSAEFKRHRLQVLLEEIRAYALEHSTTRVIGGAHAALRKIAEMAGGGE